MWWRIVFSLLLPGTTLVHAQTASLNLIRGSALACPSSPPLFTTILLNATSATQSIPAGTVFTLTYSVPVLAPPTASAAAVRASGNTATATFSFDLSLQSGFTYGFRNAQLDLTGIPTGTPVSVSLQVSPATAVSLGGEGSGTVLGITDLSACTPPPPQTAVTIDELTATCPTEQDVADFNKVLALAFPGDPTPGVLVCRASQGSADLTRLQERAYQALKVMRQTSYDAPLPWTAKPLYDWLIQNIHGIDFRSDVPLSYCCEPGGVIVIQSSSLIVEQVFSTDALIGFISLIVHEARHNEGVAHTCLSMDKTLDEMGAWAAQYYFMEWSSFHSGGFLNPGGAGVFGSPVRNVYWTDANSILAGEICSLAPGVVASPSALNFGAQSTAIASLPRTVVVTATQGPPAAVAGATVAITGPNAADFTITSNTCRTASGSPVMLPPSCVLSLVFTPQAASPRFANLQVTFPGLPTQQVALAGLGGNAPCSYQLLPNAQLLPPKGGAGTFTVTASPGCAWTAVSNASWISVTFTDGGKIAYSVDANTGGSVRQGTIGVGGFTFSVAQSGYAPQFLPAGVTNAASFAPGASPGSLVSIFGNRLARNVSGVVAAGAALPLTLGGSSVQIAGRISSLLAPAYLGPVFGLPVSAPILAVAGDPSPQINAQVPWELAGLPSANFVVDNGAGSAPVLVALSAVQPGIFTVGGAAGAVLHNSDLTPVTPSSPAVRGEIVAIYATGLGPVNPPVATGAPAPSAEPFARTTDTPLVSFGGVYAATVPFSGLAPRYVGVYQVNAQVPATAPSGNAVPLSIAIGGVTSNTVTIGIK